MIGGRPLRAFIVFQIGAADRMGRKVSSVAPLRSTLISKGMVYSPEHGDTAFTVPLFGEFMKRTMPDRDENLPLF